MSTQETIRRHTAEQMYYLTTMGIDVWHDASILEEGTALSLQEPVVSLQGYEWQRSSGIKPYSLFFAFSNDAQFSLEGQQRELAAKISTAMQGSLLLEQSVDLATMVQSGRCHGVVVFGDYIADHLLEQDTLQYDDHCLSCIKTASLSRMIVDPLVKRSVWQQLQGVMQWS